MTWPYSYFADICLPVFTACLLITLSVYSWPVRSVPRALWITMARLFTALWSVGSILEYAAINFEAKITRVKFQVLELTQTSHHLMRLFRMPGAQECNLLRPVMTHFKTGYDFSYATMSKF